MTEYQMYLQSPHWRALRARKKALSGYRCKICGRAGDEITFAVHHLRYHDEMGPILYREDIEKDLMCLCPDCHETVHRFLDEFSARVDSYTKEQIRGASVEEAVFPLQYYIALVGQKYWPQNISFFEDKDYQHFPDSIGDIACNWLAWESK